MRLLSAVVVFLLGSACSSSPAAVPGSAASSTRTQPSASQAAESPVAAGGGGGNFEQPSPAPTPVPPVPAAPGYAVLVDLFTGPETYGLALVGYDGTVAQKLQPRQRSSIKDAIDLPYVSTSKTRVYYLDGDRQVRWIKPDGTGGVAATLPGSATIRATFAVSPDDTRIAVGLLDYSTSPVKLTIYTESIGGSNHRVIYTSTNHYVWPVAWHAGQLVVAYIGPNAVPFKSRLLLYGDGNLSVHPYGPSPYGGINFHVIDPVTAVRKAIISGGGASGLLSKAGVAVVQGDADDWNGTWLDWSSPNDYGSYSAAGSLSPDGTVIAACCDHPAGAGNLVLWYRGGTIKVIGVNASAADWVGWFDNRRLITGFYQASVGIPSVVDIYSGELIAVPARGIVVAMLPGGFD